MDKIILIENDFFSEILKLAKKIKDDRNGH